MAKNNSPTNGQKKELPQPNVEWVRGGTPPAAMTAAGVKGILVNPLNAGAGPFPPLVSDAHWVGPANSFWSRRVRNSSWSICS
jgi:hypothetical protein